MKKLVTSVVAVATLAGTMYADDLQSSLVQGTVTADLRAFYFNGDRDNRTDREALAVGGILKYVSDDYYGFRVGSAFYVSHDLLHKGDETAQKGSIDNGAPVNLVTKNVAGNTEMVNPDGSAIEVMGEAYVQYNVGNTMLKVGRQRLNTPLMNDYYNRFLPNTFEAFLLTNKDLSDTELMAIYATRWKYKGSDTFKGMTDGLNNPLIDENVMMVGLINKSIENTKIQAYNYYVPNIMNSAYFQVDAKNFIKSDSFSVSASLQYLDQKEVGDELLGTLDSYLAGAKLKVSMGNFSLTGVVDQVGDYTIEGSGTDYSAMGWSKFINFTDIQIDGEALNAGALSYGGMAAYSFGSGRSVAVKYIRIDQDLEKEATGHTSNTRPSSDEYNLDIKYKIDDVSKLRVRLAYIDYESTHPNEFDEVNTRIIYDYKFTLTGKI